MRIINTFFAIAILGLSFITFKAFSPPLVDTQVAMSKHPSMVPGTHALRPEAGHESQRDVSYSQDEELSEPAQILFGTKSE